VLRVDISTPRTARQLAGKLEESPVRNRLGQGEGRQRIFSLAMSDGDSDDDSSMTMHTESEAENDFVPDFTGVIPYDHVDRGEAMNVECDLSRTPES
jgi:hypothetical protein